MTTLTMYEAAHILAEAGFRFGDGSLTSMLAVAIAESTLNTRATNTEGNHPPSRDRGWLQINSYWHPEVTDAEAFDARAAAAAAYRISKHGKVFEEWTTWQDGAAARYLPGARQVAAVIADHRHPLVLGRALQLLSPPLAMMHGHDVATLQYLLGSPAEADGVFGPLTKSKVSHFQTAEGIQSDGVVGPITAGRLGWTWAGPTT